jgi:hypothetical protein
MAIQREQSPTDMFFVIGIAGGRSVDTSGCWPQYKETLEEAEAQRGTKDFMMLT